MTSFAQLDGLQYSIEDLQRKFKGAVCQFRIKDVVFVDEVVEFTATQMQFLRSGKRPRKDVILVKERPESCVVNHNDGIIYFMSYPARQFRRGCHGNNSMTIDENGVQYEQPPIEHFDSLFNPSTTDMFEAIDLLLAGKAKARALPNKLYWMKKEDNQVHLYRKATRVAIWMNGKFYYEKCAQTIEVELKDDLGVV